MSELDTTNPVVVRRHFAANERLAVEQFDRMWVVREGSVEVFVARALDGEPVGSRRWLFTAGTGSALFALPPAPNDELVLVAVAATAGDMEELDRKSVV